MTEQAITLTRLRGQREDRLTSAGTRFYNMMTHRHETRTLLVSRGLGHVVLRHSSPDTSRQAVVAMGSAEAAGQLDAYLVARNLPPAAGLSRTSLLGMVEPDSEVNCFGRPLRRSWTGGRRQIDPPVDGTKFTVWVAANNGWHEDMASTLRQVAQSVPAGAGLWTTEPYQAIDRFPALAEAYFDAGFYENTDAVYTRQGADGPILRSAVFTYGVAVD